MLCEQTTGVALCYGIGPQGLYGRHGNESLCYALVSRRASKTSPAREKKNNQPRPFIFDWHVASWFTKVFIMRICVALAISIAVNIIKCGKPQSSYQSVVCQSGPQADLRFCNDTLDFATRADDLLGRLTVEELINQTSSIAPAISRLGINAYNWRSNCLHGWSKSGGKWQSNLKWTVFPAPIGLGATFDTDLLYTAGKITSDEGRALHNVMLQEFKGESTEAAGLNCFSPNVNLFRDPRWGRGQETYGEDPYLLSMLGVAYTRGLQEGKDPKYLKVAACAKHYVVHSGPEELRLSFVANVSLYDLYSTYLPAFKSQVLAGKVAQMMPAYSGVRVPKFSDDGAPDCANQYILKSILREEFNAPNISVCSDNGGISFVFASHKYVKTPEEAAAVSINASTDLDLGFDRFYSKYLQNALNEHLVDEQNIKDAVWRSFYLRMILGDFDPPSQVMYQSIGKDHLDTSENQAANVEAAMKSIVLLKNKNAFLPLVPSSLKAIAIIGPNANSESVLLSNYEGIPSEMVTIEKGITGLLGDGVKVSTAPGCSNVTCPDKDGKLLHNYRDMICFLISDIQCACINFRNLFMYLIPIAI